MDKKVLFVSDLHGDIHKYHLLFGLIESEKPKMVFLGGDLMPSGLFALVGDATKSKDFIHEILIENFSSLRKKMGDEYPKVYLILGNDDSKSDEKSIREGEEQNLWEYIHEKKTKHGDLLIAGYSNIPPSPFLMKDFEKYDVSRYVDPGCVPPEEGVFSTDVNLELLKISTIKKDLDLMFEGEELLNSILLFHCPPYQTKLDRAALDGKTYEHVPLDVHIGSIAIQRFISKRQPKITLHGHVHESTSITGSWKDQIGESILFSAAHDGPELVAIIFDPDKAEEARRLILP